MKYRNYGDLTTKEIIILQSASEGKIYKQIVDDVNMSFAHLKNTISQSILPKLKASNITHAVAIALRRGIIT